MKKVFVCLALILALAADLMLPAAAAEEVKRPWEEAYASKMAAEAEKWGNYFVLVDLDLDGVPELLIGSVPGSGLFSSVESAFTFKDGQLQELQFESYEYKASLDPYELWYNSTTGAWRINTELTLRAGYGYYTNMIAEKTLSGANAGGKTVFAIDTSSNNGSEVKTYYVNGKNVGLMMYDMQLGLYWGKPWTKIEQYGEAALLKSYGKASAAEIQELIASYADGPVAALPSTHNVAVDGTAVNVRGYNIGGNNYFKLRDVAMALSGSSSQFQVSWDAALRSISLTSGQSYTPVGGEMAAVSTITQIGLPCKDALYINGKAAAGLTAYNINGNNFFKIRDLADALGFTVEWIAETRTVNILTDNWDAKVGTTIANIKENGEYTRCYSGPDNISAAGGYTGQCTWYAYGRFMELTDIKLNTALAAKKWLDENANDPRVNIVYDIEAPSIAVNRTMGSGNGHVMFVEHVTYDANGQPLDVYFTESNMDSNGSYNEGVDCVLIKMSYSEFISRRAPSGYIVPAK